MRLYLSAMRINDIKRYRERRPDAKLNVLLSYPYLNGDTSEILAMWNRGELSSVILDSGAYTDQNAQRPTNLAAYIAYLQGCGQQYDHYFNLDSDFSEMGFSAQNLENLIQMRQAGLDPVPVIHSVYGGEVQYYVNQASPIVALGSAQARDMRVMRRVFAAFLNLQTKFHIFGATDYSRLIEVPAFSCDSSTWRRAGIPCHLRWWNPASPAVDKTEKIYFGSFDRERNDPTPYFNEYRYLGELQAYLKEELNFELYQLVGPYRVENLMTANIHHFVKLEKLITEEHLRRGFPY
ncbi:hypothetical protein [Desulfoferula mesophila]|uniref:Uncharacterized protein n=1 Tax=Desulfoferula mesophila TaxID=3058419 RepID=A0AAU9EZV1_9BACT|nr:hypothetical protein FAK_14830 [Desulfoferula mesophilus]